MKIDCNLVWRIERKYKIEMSMILKKAGLHLWKRGFVWDLNPDTLIRSQIHYHYVNKAKYPHDLASKRVQQLGVFIVNNVKHAH